jgi:hypothetical protein
MFEGGSPSGVLLATKQARKHNSPCGHCKSRRWAAGRRVSGRELPTGACLVACVAGLLETLRWIRVDTVWDSWYLDGSSSEYDDCIGADLIYVK